MVQVHLGPLNVSPGQGRCHPDEHPLEAVREASNSKKTQRRLPDPYRPRRLQAAARLGRADYSASLRARPPGPGTGGPRCCRSVRMSVCPIHRMTRSELAGQVRLPDGWAVWTDSDMQGGPVDELFGVAVERPALDQLEVEVGCTLEDRVLPGLTGDHREERHLDAVD